MSLRSNSHLTVISARLLAGDAVKTLIAAPGADRRLRIFSILATIVTAAAQQIDVGVAAGTVDQQIFSIPASATVPTDYWSDWGFVLPVNTALSADPAAAGPAVQFLIEYISEPVVV